MATHTDPNLNGFHAPVVSAEARRRAARRWIIIPVGLIVTQMSIVIVMMYIATSDPTFAVEPHYYEKALAWDATAAQNQTNQRLAWRTEVTASVDESGAGQLRVRLTNSDALPLDGAAISAELFANTNARARAAFDLVPRGDGVYAARAAFDRSGMWECRLVVNRGPETFTAARQIRVDLPGEARQ
jgi:nitrogen fixation protein FixH